MTFHIKNNQRTEKIRMCVCMQNDAIDSWKMLGKPSFVQPFFYPQHRVKLVQRTLDSDLTSEKVAFFLCSSGYNWVGAVLIRGHYQPWIARCISDYSWYTLGVSFQWLNAKNASSVPDSSQTTPVNSKYMGHHSVWGRGWRKLDGED